jgi:hypothetical protein
MQQSRPWNFNDISGSSNFPVLLDVPSDNSQFLQVHVGPQHQLT